MKSALMSEVYSALNVVASGSVRAVDSDVRSICNFVKLLLLMHFVVLYAFVL